MTTRSSAAHVAIGVTAFLAEHIETPSQYADRHRRGAIELQPEKRLMLAVLEDAIDTWRRYRGSSNAEARGLARDATEWLSSDDESHLFTYRRCCEAIGLDPEYLRRGLRAWQDRADTPPTPLERRAVVVMARLGTQYVKTARIARAIGVDPLRVARWRKGAVGDCTAAEVDAMEAYLARVVAARQEGTTMPALLRQLTDAGWSQVRIARRLQVTEQAVSGWVTGRCAPSRTYQLMLRALVADGAPTVTPAEPAAC